RLHCRLLIPAPFLAAAANELNRIVLFFVRLLLDRSDLIPRAANGVHERLRVQLCFREDHGLVFAAGGVYLFDRAGFANSVIDMSLAHPAHHSVDFHCVLPHVLSLLLDFWIIELRGPEGGLPCRAPFIGDLPGHQTAQRRQRTSEKWMANDG